MDYKEELQNKLIIALAKYAPDNMQDIQNDVMLCLARYEITMMETQIVKYEGNLNEELLKKFLISKKIQGCTDRTLNAYYKVVRDIFYAIGKPATEITTDDLRIFLAEKQIRDGVSKSYANTLLRYVGSFYAWATMEEIVSKNPTLRIGTIKQDKQKKKAFTDLEVEKIRNGCKTTREKAIVEVLLSTGCRISELCSIRIDEIKDGKVYIKGKGNKYRYVYLNAKAELAVENYLADRKDANPFLFPKALDYIHKDTSEKTSKLARKVKSEWFKYPELVGEGESDKSTIGALVRKTGKKVGVANVHPHKFRRTCATFALRHGMPLEQVSKMLGHANLATTQIYLDLTEEELELAHKKYVV